MSEKYTFDDFLSTVDGDNREFVRELHEELTKLGCKTEIKQAKSGYVVSCLQKKKDDPQLRIPQKGTDGPHLSKPSGGLHGGV